MGGGGGAYSSNMCCTSIKFPASFSHWVKVVEFVNVMVVI